MIRVLFLGDIVGEPGRKAVIARLAALKEQESIDFIVVNGENAADDGKGITKLIAKEFFLQGVDVITSGNHIWDKKEIIEYINQDNRLLRPSNLAEGTPGNGYGIYFTKNKKFKVGVINLMGNVFMRKTEDVFQEAKKILEKMILKTDVDFSVVDFHGEITSEKMAIGHFFDGLSTGVVGTHTHVPTADTRILEKGTAYAVFDGHTANDKTPYAYKTDDFGKTWKSIITGGVEGVVRNIQVDYENPDLLFLGTELGLFITMDGGAQWYKYTNNMPAVAVHFIALQKQTNDLVLGTHGRGVIIIDDISPLRSLNKEVLSKKVHFFDSDVFYMSDKSGSFGNGFGAYD